jgi:hypothetical protein
MVPAIERVIRERYEKRALENSTVPYQFNIMTDSK